MNNTNKQECTPEDDLRNKLGCLACTDTSLFYLVQSVMEETRCNHAWVMSWFCMLGMAIIGLGMIRSFTWMDLAFFMTVTVFCVLYTLCAIDHGIKRDAYANKAKAKGDESNRVLAGEE
jgi:hypothetical protein